MVVVSAERRTPTYTKPMAGGRELNRLDIKNRTPTPSHLEDAILERLPELIARVDALVVLDQVSEENCGVVTSRVREAICAIAEARGGSLFVLTDSRERIGEFRHVTVKPNERECGPDILGLARRVGGSVFCTRGQRGIDFARPGDTESVGVPGYRVAGPIDVCGAGDSCTAGLVAAKLAGLSDLQAAAFANLVASITVQQVGTTGTATPAQVRARWAEVIGASS